MYLITLARIDVSILVTSSLAIIACNVVDRRT